MVKQDKLLGLLNYQSFFRNFPSKSLNWRQFIYISFQGSQGGEVEGFTVKLRISRDFELQKFE